MKDQTCCFTGHRKIPPKDLHKIKKHLPDEIEKLIRQGVRYFGTGGALGFDTLAAQAIIELRKTHPHIKLILILPCREQTRGWNKTDIKIYRQIIAQADKVVYTSEHYHAGCMHKRNRYLIDNSAFCICYLTHSGSGTAYTVEYAARSGVQIIPIFPGE